jgi:RimJ/RimL family protein N-acetyltransferase
MSAEPVIETERLQLRTWTAADLTAYAKMFADPDVAQFLSPGGQPMTRAEAWRGLALVIGHWELRGFGMFAVIERATNELVGRIGPLEPEGWPDFEIGWGLRREYWGRGYAAESVRACIKYSFLELGVPHLISVIDPANVRSIALAEKVGERLEGTTSLPHLPNEALLQYGLYRKDW